MSGYSAADVQRMLGITRGVITALVEAGFVAPTLGKRREQRFSFEDLVVMKAARELAGSHIGAKRIAASLKALRKQLPAQLPLGGLRISAAGNRSRQRVVVRQGGAQWQPDSGQFLLDFEVLPRADAHSSVSFIESRRKQPSPAEAAHDCFAHGCDLEESDAQAAVAAYQRAVELDEGYINAYVNLGRLLHAQRKFAAAERTYRAALQHCEPDALLLFNLGVLLDDQERAKDAALAYRSALRLAPDMADAHYNLALLYEREGLAREALKHLNTYRRLQG
jgi:tetratricopeptide (TPR) repeat protein